jgi:hypothetical protein
MIVIDWFASFFWGVAADSAIEHQVSGWSSGVDSRFILPECSFGADEGRLSRNGCKPVHCWEFWHRIFFRSDDLLLERVVTEARAAQEKGKIA